MKHVLYGQNPDVLNKINYKRCLFEGHGPISSQAINQKQSETDRPNIMLQRNMSPLLCSRYKTTNV